MVCGDFWGLIVTRFELFTAGLSMLTLFILVYAAGQ